jgi:hypothetical protein
MTSEQVLSFQIENGPPELDFLFALARGTKVSLTISTEHGKGGMGVFIDGIIMYKTIDRSSFKVFGHFEGDGKKTWSGFPGPNGKKYYLWGKFRGAYYKTIRKGYVITNNFSLDYPLNKK